MLFMICLVESPGKPAAHKSAYLPLLPSGPDGVHKILLHRARTLQKTDHVKWLKKLAERGGFEPPRQLQTAYTISNRAPSTARTPLQ